eukprot:scpid38234/ scgid18755/ 
MIDWSLTSAHRRRRSTLSSTKYSRQRSAVDAIAKTLRYIVNMPVGDLIKSSVPKSCETSPGDLAINFSSFRVYAEFAVENAHMLSSLIAELPIFEVSHAHPDLKSFSQ